MRIMIMKLLCRIGIHDWSYSGYAYSIAPSVIRCYYCGKEYK